ncbi:MAG: DNA polymerase III subunit alpha [Magnetococcales bacterium]|nr:DNA polymerase III subunit alpha [Magnetococcales bacterium]
MAHARFVHLHVHTCYSLLKSTVRIESLIERAKSWRMPALAIADQGNLFAAIAFYTQCLKSGIKPLMGAQILVVPDRLEKRSRHDREVRDQLVLLCRNQTGWRNLLAILSIGYNEGMHGAPRVDAKVLDAHSEGLIVLSGGLKGEVARHLLAGHADEAREAAMRWATCFAGRDNQPNFYMEIQRHGLPGEEGVNARLVALAQELDLPLVATGDVHFLRREEQKAQEVLACIGLGLTLNHEERPRLDESHALLSPQEMAQRFADLPEALENTLHIARRCNLQLRLGKPMLPHYPRVPEGLKLEGYLSDLARQGLERRLAEYVCVQLPEELTEETGRAYRDRLNYELGVIVQMGFAGYFLIVSDFIRHAKHQGIPVGPGRGSGAGSLVAYALDITDLDPIEHQLLFERFLNPERVSMPDFDVDFCQDRRGEVIEYVKETYGADRVAQIITFGTLMARAVLRDVGRVMEFPYSRVDRIAKLVPPTLGITLKDALEQEDKLRQMVAEDPDVGSLVEMALILEGLPRSAGTHAAGVVISDGPLTDTVPLYRDPRSDMPVTQFNMGDAEKAGLVKFDFLGLKTLTVIDQTLKMVNATRAADEAVDVALLPMDDRPTFKLLCDGHTRGVFQLESSGMRELLRRLAPDTFADIVALVALYRPGPLGSGMVDDFINGKHGRVEVRYFLPELEPILKETYGVILYQEQVMQIARVLAGYTLGGADLLRRAMGKKKLSEMAAQRQSFLEGARNHRVPVEMATHIFELMEKFAGYGFNKSHSAAYALISYQTAWLKAHYPREFLAATLTCDMENTDKVITFVRECQSRGIPVLSPDCNRSGKGFTVEEKGIRFGLAAIKNVGEGAVDALLAARSQGGAFKDLGDLCRRSDASRLNRRVMENLIKSGACDALGPHRAALLEELPAAMGEGVRRQEAKAMGLRSLFGEEGEETVAETGPNRRKVPPWTDAVQLEAEKEALGFYITGHPLRKYAEEFASYGLESTGSLRERLLPGEAQAEGAALATTLQTGIAGLVIERKLHKTRKGDRMAFITVEDMDGQIEVVIFPEVFEACRGLLESDAVVVVEGVAEAGEDAVKMVAERVQPLQTFRKDRARCLILSLNEEEVQAVRLERLRMAWQPFQGGACQIFLKVRFEVAHGWYKLGEACRVQPEEALLTALIDELGSGRALFRGSLPADLEAEYSLRNG